MPMVTKVDSCFLSKLTNQPLQGEKWEIQMSPLLLVGQDTSWDSASSDPEQAFSL